jgi:hypothetical protein
MYYMAAPENSRKVGTRAACGASIMAKHHEESVMMLLKRLWG